MEKDRHEIEIFKIDQMFIGDSQEELIKQGEGRRKEHPIAAISTFNPVKRDVFQLIKLTEEKMIPELLGMRHKRMMQNPFSYFRATAGIMEKDPAPVSRRPVPYPGNHLRGLPPDQFRLLRFPGAPSFVWLERF